MPTPRKRLSLTTRTKGVNSYGGGHKYKSHRLETQKARKIYKRIHSKQNKRVRKQNEHILALQAEQQAQQHELIEIQERNDEMENKLNSHQLKMN